MIVAPTKATCMITLRKCNVHNTSDLLWMHRNKKKDTVFVNPHLSSSTCHYLSLESGQMHARGKRVQDSPTA